MVEEHPIGIFGGSGIYEMAEMEVLEERTLDTPFGDPSDAYIMGLLNGRRVVFLSRHGRGHRVPASRINYRANIFGFKQLGVEALISVNTVGSMREHLHPTHIVIPDQMFDFTRSRPNSFFADGPAVHVDLADPICGHLAQLLFDAGEQTGATVHLGGISLTIEGNSFSTRAESAIFRAWGVDLIGMTTATEAKLSREAEICYASLSLVTDYDVWKESAEDVSAGLIIENLLKTAEAAKRIIKHVLPSIPGELNCTCRTALKDAIFTSPDAVPEETRRRLAVLLGDYLPVEE